MKISEFTNPEEFQRFCSVLLSAEHPDFQSIDDSGGDLGIDGYIQDNAIFMIYCPEKPQKNTGADQKRKISSDIKKAIKTIKSRNLSVKKLIFITPMNLRTEIILHLEDQCKTSSLKGISYGEDKLTELASKYSYIQKQFPFLLFPDIASDIAKIKDTVNAIKEVFCPSSQKRGEEERDIFGKEPRLKEALKSYQAGDLDKFLRISREIYYETIDDKIKLQAILNITFNSIAEEKNSELIHMCGEGIRIAERSNLLNKIAILMAQKAMLIQVEIDCLRTHMWFEKQVAEKIGVFDEPKYSLQLKQSKEKQEQVDKLLQDAADIACTNKLYWTLAGVYTIVGNMTANTYITISKTQPDLAGFYDNRCKSSLSAAKKIYSALGCEEGVINSMHNLANHLRATGEIGLSKKYAKEVLQKAKEKGFAVIALKSSEMLCSLEHMTAADYAEPPHKFLEKMKKRRKTILETFKKEP